MKTQDLELNVIVVVYVFGWQDTLAFTIICPTGLNYKLFEMEEIFFVSFMQCPVQCDADPWLWLVYCTNAK